MRLFLFLLVGCSPGVGQIDLGPGDGIEPDTDTDADADTDTDTDTDADTDTDTDTDVEPGPEIDFSFWDGRRTLMNGDCAGVIAEEGEAYDEDWVYWDSSKDLCPECDYFYGLSARPGWVCDVRINTEPYRALSIGDDGEIVVLYWSDDDWDYVPLAEDGQMSGTDLKYTYTWPWGDTELKFDGTVYFEEMD